MTTSTYEVSLPVALATGRASDPGRVETVQARVLVLSRCVLALSGLAIIWIDPTGPTRLVEWTYASLVIYCLYSVVIAFMSYGSRWPTPHRVMHWIDVLFFAYLIALTGSASSFYVIFFVYPILVASFSRGFREGILVTLTSLALFTSIGFVLAPIVNQIEVGRILIRTVFLLIFGYMISYLGGYERKLRGRLALLKNINDLWTPRFGVDHAYGINLERLLEFYDGSSCVLILRRLNPELQYIMYVALRGKPGYSKMPSKVDESAAEALLRLPTSLAAYYHDPRGPWWLRYRGYSAYDFDLGVRTQSFHEDCAVWTNLLDAKAFVTVPYSQRDGVTGRLFLTADNAGFSHADIDFLAQVADAMSTVGENMSLVEELISKAAEHERLAISRDLHDTTIQPYIGLKLALDALNREAGNNNALSTRISEIIAMTEMTVRDLRSYAATFKEHIPMPGQFLVEAVKHQAERLERFYGIRVELTSDISLRLNGRLAAEAFQIISEGLSNILRHSPAKNAFVTILCEDTQLLLQIGNELNADAPDVGEFMPRSISERAQALKGKTYVERRADHYTVVHVTIPF